MNLQDFSTSLLALLFEGIPFLLLGAILSGLIDAFVPASWLTRFMPKNSFGALLIAGCIGFLFPMCECGVVPVVRRLLRKGLPVACALTYMLASPIVNPLVAISTFAAFKGNFPEAMTTSRLLLGFIIAVLAGAVAMRFRPEQLLRADVVDQLTPKRRNTFASGLAAADAPVADSPTGFRHKLTVAVRGATGDFLDTMVYFVIGAALASIFNTAVRRDFVDQLASNELGATLSMMVLAFVLSICSTSDAFVAATMVKFPMVSKLAFLVFGPMLDIKLVVMYSMVYKRKTVLVLALGLFAVVAFACMQFGVAFSAPVP